MCLVVPSSAQAQLQALQGRGSREGRHCRGSTGPQRGMQSTNEAGVPGTSQNKACRSRQHALLGEGSAGCSSRMTQVCPARLLHLPLQGSGHEQLGRSWSAAKHLSTRAGCNRWLTFGHALPPLVSPCLMLRRDQVKVTTFVHTAFGPAWAPRTEQGTSGLP